MHNHFLIALGLSVVLGFGACTGACGQGKSKQQGEQAEPATQSPGPVDTPGEAPVETIDVKALFAGAAPTMPVQLQALRFGMPRPEAELVVPDLAAPGGWRDPGELKGVTIRAGYFQDKNTLRYVHVDMPATARKGLEALWGKAREGQISSAKKGWFWHNPEAGVQAVLEDTGAGMRLALWPFVPWKALLGSAPTTLGFESKPLLGMSEQAIMDEYAHALPRKIKDGRIDLLVPGYEFHPTRVPVILSLDGGTVTQVYFKLHYGYFPGLKADMEAAFKAKFGEPARVDRISTVWREQDPTITMDHSEPTSQFAFWFKVSEIGK